MKEEDRRYHEKCTQSTFTMPKAIAKIGKDNWTKDNRKTVILAPLIDLVF